MGEVQFDYAQVDIGVRAVNGVIESVGAIKVASALADVGNGIKGGVSAGAAMDASYEYGDVLRALCTDLEDWTGEVSKTAKCFDQADQLVGDGLGAFSRSGKLEQSCAKTQDWLASRLGGKS